MTRDGRRTTPWVWHKLPTGEPITDLTELHTSSLYAFVHDLNLIGVDVTHTLLFVLLLVTEG